MQDGDIYVKTARGFDEVRQRSAKLPQRTRSMLIMVDGSLRVADLRQAALTMGAPSDFLDTLVQHGLIALLQAAAPRQTSGPVTVPLARPQSASAALPATAPELPSAPGTDAERFRTAVKFMNDTAVDALGFRAFFFTLKLEKCGALADLRALLPEYLKVVEKGSGEATARVLEARVREMLR